MHSAASARRLSGELREEDGEDGGEGGDCFATAERGKTARVSGELKRAKQPSSPLMAELQEVMGSKVSEEEEAEEEEAEAEEAEAEEREVEGRRRRRIACGAAVL